MKKMEQKFYKFVVSMPGKPDAEVIAPDRYFATRDAARTWGVIWRETARDMTVRQISKRPVRKPT